MKLRVGNQHSFSSVFYLSNTLFKNFAKKFVVLGKYVSKVWNVYSLRFDTVEIDLCAMLSAPDCSRLVLLPHCLLVFGKVSKYYSSKCAKLMQSSVKIL